MALSYTHCNGLAMFIQDLEETYKMSFDDASRKAALEWEDLPEDKRVFFYEKAMDSVSRGVDLTRKFNSEGQSYANVAIKEMQESEQRQIMLLYLEDKLSRLAFPDEFLEEKFVLCHVNYFYIIKDKIFRPAEIALCEFNLKNGLLRTVHKFIHPGTVELGYRCEAKEMEKVHGISLDDPNIPFVDSSQLYSSVINFIQVDNKKKARPVYTMPNCLESNRGVSAVEDTLKQIASASGNEEVIFKVFQCSVLLYKILQRINVELKLDLEKSDELYFHNCTTWIENDTFSHCKKLACLFHEDNDLTNVCSLSIVKRWAYTLCDRILPLMRMEPQRGSHIPRDAKPRNVWRRRQPNYVPPDSSDIAKNNQGGGDSWKTIQSHHSHRGESSRFMATNSSMTHNNQRKARGGSRGQNSATGFKSFTMEDHSTGSVSRIISPVQPKPNTPTTEKGHTNAQGDTKTSSGQEGAYAVALRGKALPPVSNSLADFPDLRISGKCSKCHLHCSCMKNLSEKSMIKPDGADNLDFPPLQASNPWRRGKK